MTCNNSIHHDLNCPDSYNNNSLKCASAVVNQQQKQFVFNQQEVNILSKSLEVCKFYITKNKNQYQNPQDILKELTMQVILYLQDKTIIVLKDLAQLFVTKLKDNHCKIF